jgi:beta-glucanase (GH16 family)
MFSAWMVGVEDVPERSGEICLVEVFGETLRAEEDGSITAAVGSGIHPFRDRGLVDEFTADRRVIDVDRFHTYAIDWERDRVRFFIDGVVVRTVDQAPDYPMQLILGVFDFPDRGSADPVVPELVVRAVRGVPLGD